MEAQTAAAGASVRTVTETTSADDAAARIAAGYATAGPALVLGSVVHDGRPHPDAQVQLPLAMLNRHGLIAGATGTGKTKTLQLMAEQLSAAGVPVVVADIKGDLSGLAAPGAGGDRVVTRAADTADTWTPTGYPVEYLSLGGIGPGVPVRATMTQFGPVLLSKVLDLNATQESSLGLVFHYADQAGLPLLDLKDLRSVISWLVSDEGKADLKGLGGLSSSTAGVLLRELIGLEQLGGDVFFGEPEWEPADLLRTAADGRGVISAVELPAVQDRPALFSTFLMWLLAELFEELPEVGDVEQPKLVFFLDEAHLLFTGASKAFLESVTQTVRLIRSKGVGVFFVTQNPTDVPSSVLGQLGNRVQHALRTFTPEDATALRKTVKTFPTSTDYDVAEMLTSLGTGEAAGDGAVRPWDADAAGVDDAAGAAVADGSGPRGRPAAVRRGVAADGEVRAAGGPGVGVRAAGRSARPAIGRCRCARREEAGTASSSAGARARTVRWRGRRRARLGGVPVVHAVGGVRAGPGDHPRPVRHPQAPPVAERGDCGRGAPR
ncbi:hypothetical protein JD78_02157 [Modestobacter roseus]|uniref:Helicase HerA-like C-terminal domain-containing protein n=1 Tax=Modestobacter roseus TaxID=1181884 RepID=A0A562ISD4_9ACTN|nr:hypothetical protein JD78_02157 [Modestobacter roseus]